MKNYYQAHIMCCDTTLSNTGRLNGACVLLDQKLDKELFIFAYRHHVYERVLKSAFESKIHQGSPDIPLFQKFRDNWKNINPNAIETCTDFAKQHICDAIINGLVTFFNHELQKSIHHH